jgi:hypothetical protein
MTAEQLCAALRDDGRQFANEAADLIDTLRGALADIGFSDDMTGEMAKAKARRIYQASADPAENEL